MRFPSRWQFQPGTTLAMTLEIAGTTTRAQVEGVVVECEKTGVRMWEVTVLFLEKPAGLGKLHGAKMEIREGIGGPLLA